jgi:hypothetical protein
MRVRSLTTLLRQSLWRARATLGLAAFGVTVGIGAFAFFLALSGGMSEAVSRIFPTDRLEVAGASGGGGALGLLGGGAPALDDEDLARIRGLKGVSDAQPRLRFGFPVKAWGGEELLQGTRYTELIGDGVPSSLVSDLPEGSDFDDLTQSSSGRQCQDDAGCPRGEYCDTGGEAPSCQRYIPALFSPFLMEIYNNYLAPGGGLPQINSWMMDRVRGLTFHVQLGQSYMGRATCGGRQPCTPRTVTMRLAGMSRHAVDLGITVPIEYVRRWNAEYGEEGAESSYSTIAIQAEHDDEITSIVAQVRRLGYEVPSNRAQQAGLTITIITALLTLTSSLIILVAAVNIAHTFFTLVHERRGEIGLYRALGASRGDVRSILLAEAAAVGVSAGVLGMLLAWGAALGCDWAWNEYVPSFPFKPESLFSFSPALIAMSMGFAVLCCLVGAYLPARRAAAMDPARVLSS